MENSDSEIEEWKGFKFENNEDELLCFRMLQWIDQSTRARTSSSAQDRDERGRIWKEKRRSRGYDIDKGDNINHF